ncbi:melatonin receptor type 1A-like [Orbicella faveolata]|uniref:melatonin receptor type 1A-like n=1 Tax=Orbicella faveolata TaxID=48498 RepID=UPI0009E1E07D|nr:melatonin receptor type 1A-like [Orbicella faveolata]
MNESLSEQGRLQHLLSSRSTSSIVLESSIALLIFLVAVPGNTLVLLVVYKTPRLRNAAGILITSLAISDLSLMLLLFPPAFSAMITGRWLGGFYLCQISGYAVPFLCSGSLQTMALMALDRHFRIAHPIKHRTIFSVKRTKLMVVLVWLVASTVQLPYVANGGVYTFHPGKFFCFVDFSFLAKLGIVYLVVPSLVIQHFYMKVFLALRANKKRVKTLQRQSRDAFRMTAQEVKLTRTLLVTVIAYAICWTPVMIIDFVEMARGGWVLSRGAYMMYSTCGLASACINPLVYGFMNRVFRAEYMRLLGIRTLNISNSSVASVEQQ